MGTDARGYDETALPAITWGAAVSRETFVYVALATSGRPPRVRGTRLLVHNELERAVVGRRVRDGQAAARRHGTKSGRPIGRPPLDTDVTEVCNALRGRVRERGAIAEVAERFEVSRGWIYAHIVAILAWDGVL